MWSETKTIVELSLRGYQQQYLVKGECATCVQSGETFSLDVFGVDEVHRFRTGLFYTQCLDLYAVANHKNGAKGILIAIYCKSFISPFKTNM